MAHVRFVEDFNYRHPVPGAVTTAYPAGWSGSVTRACAKKAIAEKKAEAIKAPPRVTKAQAHD